MDLVDCTRVLADGMPVYPGDPPVAVEPHATLDEHGHRSFGLSLSTHSGTHLDAPAHTEPDGATVETIDPADLVLRAALVDATDRDARAAIGPAALPDDLAGLDAVAVRTGWDAHWGTDRYLAHPFLAPETAERLAAADVGVVLDCLSPDPTPATEGSGGDEGLPAHRALLGAGQPIVENCRGLGRLPADGAQFELRVAPLPVAGGDAAPARIIAVVD